MFSAAIKSGAAGNPTDPQFKYVTMLLHGDGTNGAQNNTFLDSSTNNFTITRNGNTTQGTFTPYGSNWSNYFNGSTDYLSTNISAYAFGTANFTLEAWVYLNSFTGTPRLFYGFGGSVDELQIYITTGGVLGLETNNANGATGGTIALNTWTHIAMVRNGSTITGYLNGISVCTYTDAGDVTPTTALIGSYRGSSGYLNGYVSNARVVKSAVYTSNFTPSTTPLTAITNTSLLTCQSNRFVDNSSNAYTVTANGSPSVQRFSPFSPTTAYSTSVIGGSGYFDGSGDYLSVASGSVSLTGDFTVEGWVYPTTSSGNGYYMFGLGNDYFSTGATFFITTSGYLRIYTGNANILSGTSGVVQLNTWNHIAFVRSGTTVKAYLNGVQVDSATFVSVLSGTAYINAELNGNPTATVYVGSAGYYSNVRIGTTAVYTTAFTPSTTPLSAITGTSLLLNTTNAGILDNAMMNDLETVGNAQISTSVKKYGTGSMYFDGTGDYLKTPTSPNLSFGAGNFTIEMWVYQAGSRVQSYPTLIGNNTATWAANLWDLCLDRVDSVGKITFFVYNINSVSAVVTSTSTISQNTWYHIAIVRNGTSILLFVNGTLEATGSASTTSLDTGNNYAIIGSQGSGTEFSGYIDDLRITKGYARYTANFTAPTAAFPNN